MYGFKVICVMFLINVVTSFQAPDYTVSLPVLIQNNAESIILYSKQAEDTCCNTKLKFTNNIASLSLKQCSGEVKCKSNDNWKKDIIKTTCSEIKLEQGCGRLVTDSNGMKNFNTIDCLCTELGMLCPNGIMTSMSCDKTKLQPAMLGLNDEIIYVHSSNMTGIFQVQEIKLIVVPVKGNVSIESITLKNDRLKFKLVNAKNQDCEVFGHKKICSFNCIENDCTTYCDMPKSNQTKVKLSVDCGNYHKSMWLYRNQELLFHAETESHSAWRSHSKTIGILLLLDICFGFVVFRIVFNIISIMYSLFRTILAGVYGYSNLDFYVKKYFKGYNCSICGCTIKNIYDAILHNEECIENRCPYCGDSLNNTFEKNKNHVENCKKRERTINQKKNSMKKEISRVMKNKKIEMREGFWNKSDYLSKLSKFSWFSSISILIIFLLISPSSADLMKRPCNKLIGRTNDCSKSDNHVVLKGSTTDHAGWSNVELNMLNTLEKNSLDDEFAHHALHRLKLKKDFYELDQINSIELNVGYCKSDGSCESAAEISWITDVFPGAITSYESSNDDKQKTSFNIFIADAEIVSFLDYQYKTTEWEAKSQSHFECVQANCDKYCKNDTCGGISFYDFHSTRWSHNPTWCWTVSAGCTCDQTNLLPKENTKLYHYYKVGKAVLKLLLCVEQNNIYINCVEVEKEGFHMMDKNKINVEKLDINIDLPENVIAELAPGSNKTYTKAKTGWMCPKSNCKLGFAGDLQFDDLKTDCDKGGYYIDPSGITFDLDEKAFTEPQWNIHYPSPGVNKINDYDEIDKENQFTDHTVNVEKGTLTIKGKTLGTLSVKLAIRDIQLYSKQTKAEITEFKVENCLGEYMSKIGVLCVFSANLKKEDKALITIKSNDGSSYVQSDSQLIVRGTNRFRKFMLVRNKRSSYSYCIYLNDEKQRCSDIKYNLTEPSTKWKILPGGSNIAHNTDEYSTCDYWFGFYCFFKRAYDFLHTMLSAWYLILIGVLLLIGVSFLSKFLRKQETSQFDIVEKGKMDDYEISELIKKHGL